MSLTTDYPVPDFDGNPNVKNLAFTDHKDFERLAEDAAPRT